MNVINSLPFLYLKSLIPSVYIVKLDHWHLLFHEFNSSVSIFSFCLSWSKYCKNCRVRYMYGVSWIFGRSRGSPTGYLFILLFIHLFFWSPPGIGFASCWMAYIVAFYYNMVIAWAFYYLFSSFTWTVPWSKCDHEFNTPNCWQTDWDANQTYSNRTYNSSSAVSSSFEYFEYLSSYQYCLILKKNEKSKI